MQIETVKLIKALAVLAESHAAQCELLAADVAGLSPETCAKGLALARFARERAAEARALVEAPVVANDEAMVTTLRGELACLVESNEALLAELGKSTSERDRLCAHRYSHWCSREVCARDTYDLFRDSTAAAKRILEAVK